jgi:tryptophanyl-tRNA synthetase
MQQHIGLQDEFDGFYFIANYHSLTTINDPEVLKQYTVDVALDYLAMGLDPEKACLFRQTDVPEVTELAWILSTVTGKGLLERATSYKDKIAHGIAPTMGLMCYPILMAADILMYQSDIVPVGKDQLQHIEMTQDMAGYFDNTYKSSVFTRPEPRLGTAPLVPGLDGLKMSKSYGNSIDLFDSPKNIKKRIMSIKTDSTPVEDPKNPDTCNAFAIFSLLADETRTAEMNNAYRKGGLGYGEVKKQIVELYEARFGPAREKRAALEADKNMVEDILVTGAKKARRIAEQTMSAVRDACGLITAKAGTI